MANVAVTLQKLANEATAKSFKFNKEEAAISRSWQKEMSDTSHQREVKDLVKAGLNPVLSSGGSGAQAYSTQSASGVAESAVNAIGNYESSKVSAAAMRYSAQQQAAATRAAANAAAAAQIYAANKHYDSTKYSSDSSLAATKYQTDHSKTGTPTGVLSNIIYAGATDKNTAKAANRQLIKADSMRKNADQYLRDPSKPFSVKNMTHKAIVAVNDQIRKEFGYKDFTGAQRDIYIDAYLNHDKQAMKNWMRILDLHQKKLTTAKQRAINPLRW